MHPDIRKLLKVQEVDRKLARIQRDLASLPAEEARRGKQLATLVQQSDEAADQLRRAEIESRANETSIQGSDSEIKKLQERLNSVKNNAEYQATLFQIESVNRERGTLEEDGLVLLEQLEGLRTKAAELAAKVAADQAVFNEFKQKAEVMLDSRKDEIAELEQARAAAIVDIQPDLLQKYEAIFESRDNLAVSSVEGQICTGCYSSITPNDLARLLGANSIVSCGSCQRLLYVERS